MAKASELAAKTANLQTNRSESVTKEIAKTGPGLVMENIFHSEEANARALQAEARVLKMEEELAALKLATNKKIKLSDLYEVEGRRRKLSANEYKELKNNLKNHPIITPITVRKRDQGGYEIISGHNRVAIYRELGRDEILAVVQDLDDTKSELGALYANLFHPSLPDVQKYMHFKRLKEITGKSHKELADESGADPMSITRWFSFERLPAEALALIYANPDKIGASAAMAFAQISENENKKKPVINAIKSIINGELTQEMGIKQAKEFGQTKAKLIKSETENIKFGKFKYCKLVSSNRTIRLDFESNEERELVGKLIRDVLKKRVESLPKQQ
jgi:ParB family chromosome partitioning protein